MSDLKTYVENITQHKFETEQNKIKVTKNILFFNGIVFGTAGLLGILFHGAFSENGGPVWIKNEFIGMWLSGILLFQSLQSIYIVFENNYISSRKSLELIYQILIIISATIILISYSIGGKYEALLWGNCILYVSVSNMLGSIRFIKFAEFKDQSSEYNVMKDGLDIEGNQKVDINIINHDSNEVYFTNNIPSTSLRVIKVLNVFLRLIILIIAGFLTNGSLISGAFYLKYPARGEFNSFKLKDGRIVKFHFKCEGPINSNQPTFMFEADGSHGMLDFIGVQYWLLKEGRRSCIWDKPGLGYSDYLYYNAPELISFNDNYSDFISAMNELGPFIFVGWAGGAPYVYNYAFKNPNQVKSIVYLDVYPSELNLYKQYYGWTNEQFKIFHENDVYSRLPLFKLINSIGAPFGIMSLFFPDAKAKTYPSEYKNERLWYFLNDKTWITQKQFLYEDAKFPKDPVHELDSKIPLHHIFTAYDENIINKRCLEQKLSKEKCDFELYKNKFNNEEKEKIAINGGKAIKCTDENDCNLGSYILTDPKYTVDKLVELFPKLN